VDRPALVGPRISLGRHDPQTAICALSALGDLIEPAIVVASTSPPDRSPRAAAPAGFWSPELQLNSSTFASALINQPWEDIPEIDPILLTRQ